MGIYAIFLTTIFQNSLDLWHCNSKNQVHFIMYFILKVPALNDFNWESNYLSHSRSNIDRNKSKHENFGFLRDIKLVKKFVH